MKPRLAAALASAFLTAFAFSAAAGAVGEARCVVTSNIAHNPPAQEGPAPISVLVYVLDVTRIDDVLQTFSAQIVLQTSWSDPRLHADALGWSPVGCRFPLDEIWHPHVEIVNQLETSRLWDEVLEVDDDGLVSLRQRLLGAFSSTMDLRDFPFDVQILPLRIASFRYDDTQVTLTVDENRSGRLKSFSVSGWNVDLAEPAPYREVVASQRAISGVDYRLRASRDVGFYLFKVLLPLSLIVLMAGTVFFIDPTTLAAQVGVSTAAVLTLIAFQFTLMDLLPRVSYLTRIDRFLIWSTLLVFAALGESVLSGRLAHRGREELGRRIDRASRWLYVALFSLVWLSFVPWAR